MATDLKTLSDGFIGVIAVILAVAVPASVGVAVMAGPLVEFLLGDSWLGAIPVIQAWLTRS